MSKLTQMNLKIGVESAVRDDARYFAVMVENAVDPDAVQREIIVNRLENITNGKFEYYQNVYDEELRLKAQPAISIIGFTWGNNASDIMEDFGY